MEVRKNKKNLTRMAIYGLLGGGCGFLISQITLIPFMMFLFIGGDRAASLPPIRWVLDYEFSFFIWYGGLTIAGLTLGIKRALKS